MAISNSTPKPLSILLPICIAPFLLLLNQVVCSSESLSFTIPYFSATPKSLSILLPIYIISFLVLLNQAVCLSESLSFIIPKYNATYIENIRLQGDAQFSSIGILQLTNPATPRWNTGRALYATPLRHWYAKTGELASFHTSFSFVVVELVEYNPADGSAKEDMTIANA